MSWTKGLDFASIYFFTSFQIQTGEVMLGSNRLTIFSDGDEVSFGAFPAHILQRRQTQTPSLEQLWCYMLEFQDRDYFLSDRDREVRSTSYQVKYRRHSLSEFVSSLFVPASDCVNPTKYALLNKAKAYYQDDLRGYLADLKQARELIEEDIQSIPAHRYPAQDRLPTQVLLMMIALAVGDKTAVATLQREHHFSAEVFPKNTILGNYFATQLQLVNNELAARASANKEKPWNQYKVEDLARAAKTGDTATVENIITQGNLNLNRGSVLFYAANYGHLGTVKCLVEKMHVAVTPEHFYAAGKSRTKTNGKTAKAINAYLKTQVELPEYSAADKALYTAIGKADTEAVANALTAGAKPSCQHYFITGWISKEHGVQIAQQFNQQLNAAVEQLDATVEKTVTYKLQ